MSTELEIKGGVTGTLLSDDLEHHKHLARRAAEFIVPQIQPLAIPHPEVRPDIGNVQVDFGYHHVGATKHYPYLRIYMMTTASRDITLNIELLEFAKGPNSYTNGLLEHLGPLLRNTMRRRAHKRAEAASMYRLMGGLHG